MRLILAEKHDVAEQIATYLAREKNVMIHRHGAALLVGDDDVVVHADGHLYEDFEPEDYDPRYASRTLDMLPIVPKQFRKKPRTDERARRCFDAIKEFLPKASLVLHACDTDPEGQLIGDEIFLTLKCTVPIERLPVNAYDTRSLAIAFANIRPNTEFRPLTTAAAVRSRGDWVWGMSLSTQLKIFAEKAGYKGSMSAGRVISPTLYLLAEREKRILSHKALRYYNIQAKVVVDDEPLKADYVHPDVNGPGYDPEGRLVRQAIADEIVERVRKNSHGSLLSITPSKREYQQPLPYSLSSLQYAAGREFGYSTKQVADAAKALYRPYFLISYPRANCRYLKTTHHETAGAALETIRANIPSLGPLIDKADLTIRSRAFDDDKVDPSISAHYAIKPLETLMDMSRLSTVERDVYELIARNFIAQFYPVAKTAARLFTFKFGDDTFTSQVSSLIDPGWGVVLGKDDRGAGITFDSFAPGMPARAAVVMAVPTETTAPRRLHDYDLIDRLNDVGKLIDDEALKAEIGPNAHLGTEATQTNIIERLIAHKFVFRNDKQLLFVTPVGIAVADALPKELKGPALTTRWERELAEIARGAGNASTFLNSQIELVTTIAKKPLPVFFDKQWKSKSKSAGASGGAGHPGGGGQNRKASSGQAAGERVA
jgi:DNA topoisomerase-3